jgi:putative ABC transport system permease protein
MMPSLFRRLWFLVRRSRREAELREEIETHRTLRQDRLQRDGLTPVAAARASRRALGNVALAREDARYAWTPPSWDSLWGDLRTVVRGLRKSPGFTFIAVLTLALGIGANTALFSIFNSLLLRTLPVRDPGSLVILRDGSWTFPIWEAIDRHRDALFDGAFAFAGDRFDTSQGGEASLVNGAYVSGNIFSVLGVTATRGRMLAAADDAPGAMNAVAVISYRLWQQQFSASADVIGQTISLQRVPFRIVGVMPPGFFGPNVGNTTDVMIPFAAEPLIRKSGSMLTGHWTWWLDIMARLKPGQTVAQANAALRAMQPQIRSEALPGEGSADMLKGFMSDPLELGPAATGNSELRRRFETPLTALLAVVGLVLLIACANLANLLLTRALTRRHELSVRLALGASRWRVARLLLAESLVIALAGAAMGLLFARWSSALLVHQLGTWRNAVFLDLQLDWRVLGFTAALAAFTAVMAGVVPALGVKGVGPGEALKDAGRGIAGDRRFVVRGLLVVAQVALSLVLVVGAGLFLRTFTAVTRVPLGFEPEPLLNVALNLQSSTVPPADRAGLVERLRAAAATVPGVTSAGLSAITPVTNSGWNGGVGEGGGIPDRSKMTWMNAISPGWFRTMGTRLLAGRDFEAGDGPGAEGVVIVNETFARRFLQTGSPIGQLVKAGGPRDRTAYRVVGLVQDAVYKSLRDGAVPTMYFPVAQNHESVTSLTVAAAPGQREAVQRALTLALKEVDPNVAFTYRTFDQYISGAVVQERLVAMLSAFFGGLGLLLAAIGLYGVVSHGVNSRRTEIGLRMALGASAAGIVALVVRRVGVLIVLGAVAGGSLSLWMSKYVQTLLFHLDARDPTTFVGALGVLAVAAVLAAWLPARRAAHVDPAKVLREG